MADLAVTTPNLPGHQALTPENWYVRNQSSQGFRRGKDGRRPQSAAPVSRETTRRTVSAMDMTCTYPGAEESQFRIEGSQISLEGGGVAAGRSVASTSSRPKTSGGGGRFMSKQKQLAAYQPQPQQQVPMELAERANPGRSRYAGPISPVKSQIRRAPENAGPMTMGRDVSHLHSTSPFGRDRYITNSSTLAAAAAATAAAGTATLVSPQPQFPYPVVTLDRYGYPELSSQPKPIVDHEKRVCRYSAFFYENRVWDPQCPIGTPTVETVVVRHLVISYYLVDNTVSIFEKKQQNVGIDGGKFFKRAQLFRDDDGEPLRLKDLIPGKSLKVLGQEIMVRDADSYSRGVVQYELGVILPLGLPKPQVAREDLGVHLALGMGRQPPPKRADNLYPPAYDYIQRKEALDKTHRFLFAERTPAAFECYEILDNVQAGKVPPENLQTWASRKDPNTPLMIPCSAQRLGLLYYMADYQVEVTLSFHSGEKMKHAENSTVLKKSKLPKNWHDVSKGRAAVFFEPGDFVCGNTVDLYGRIYLIVSCNNWTRDIYARDFNINQVEVDIIVEEMPAIVHEIPKFGDGFLAIGTPEETLATVYGHAHAGHALRRDAKNMGRQLRCKAVLITDKPDHARRVFNICFYMEDSSIQVYEEVVKNSGFPGGMFIKRCRSLNSLPTDQNEPRVFKAQDIYLGNVISFNGVEMRIIEMDGASLRFCEEHPGEFPMSDVFDIILRSLTFVVENAVNVRKTFVLFDATRTGMLSRSQFIDALDSMGITANLNDQELLTLIRRFKWAPNHKKKKNIFSAKKDSDDEENDDDEGASSEAKHSGAASDFPSSDDRGKYLYEELCDLLSHVHCVDTRKKRPSKGMQNMSSLEELLYEGRACTTQWRR